jgi:hypothetical protein
MKNARHTDRSQATWSRDAAFVVHLALEGDKVAGRVEHVTSGRVGRFTSADELLRFMRQTLLELERESAS